MSCPTEFASSVLSHASRAMVLCGVLLVAGCGPTTGSISGTISDIIPDVPSPLVEGAVLGLSGLDSSFRATVSEGTFNFVDVPPGTYTIEVQSAPASSDGEWRTMPSPVIVVTAGKASVAEDLKLLRVPKSDGVFLVGTEDMDDDWPPFPTFAKPFTTPTAADGPVTAWGGPGWKGKDLPSTTASGFYLAIRGQTSAPAKIDCKQLGKLDGQYVLRSGSPAMPHTAEPTARGSDFVLLRLSRGGFSRNSIPVACQYPDGGKWYAFWLSSG